VNGQNMQERAAAAAQNLFTAQPDMNVLYATGGPALIGAVAAERDQGAVGRVHLFGWDLSPQAIQGIDQGFVIGVVQQDPRNQGRQAVKAARQLIDGGSVARQIPIPVTIVTKANVDAYRSVYGS
jgi:ribose transport system substrate-binding protein